MYRLDVIRWGMPRPADRGAFFALLKLRTRFDQLNSGKAAPRQRSLQKLPGKGWRVQKGSDGGRIARAAIGDTDVKVTRLADPVDAWLRRSECVHLDRTEKGEASQIERPPMLGRALSVTPVSLPPRLMLRKRT